MEKKKKQEGVYIKSEKDIKEMHSKLGNIV